MARKQIKSPEERKLDTLKKKLGEDTVKEMEAMEAADLNKAIVGAMDSIDEAVEQRDANEDYQQAKYDVSIFNKGVGEIKTRQTAKIKFARLLLESKGLA